MRWTELSGEPGDAARSPLRRRPVVWREGHSNRARTPSRLTDQSSPLAWAQQVCHDPGAVFLDTETTGLGPTAEILDVAVVQGDGTILLNSLVRPRGAIPAQSSRIHGIYEQHVRHAPFWEDVAGELLTILEGRRVIVYNARFDSGVIARCCARARIPLPPIGYECAMLKYAAYARDANGPVGTYRWHSLEHAARQLGVEPGGHRALGDAEACRLVVRGMAVGRLPA